MAETVAPSVTVTTTFSYTGTAQTWTAPPGIVLVTVVLAGASGANASVAVGGEGGILHANLSVTPGTSYDVEVGGSNGYGLAGSGGSSGTSGTISGTPGGSGGGGSFLCVGVGSCFAGNPTVLAVAGGGGGGGGSGYDNGGGGGSCASGCPGGVGGAGGNPTTSGGNGLGTTGYNGLGGGGASTIAGGTAGGTNSGFEGSTSGLAGSALLGGAGGTGGTVSGGALVAAAGGGGGGGGGAYGGGGGGGGWGAGGGGGGSSNTSGTNATYSPGTWWGNGFLDISYADTLTAGAVTPASPAIDAGQSIVLTSHAAGGLSTLTYQWYNGSNSNCAADTAIPGATQLTYTASPTSTTGYCYSVTDTVTTQYSPVDTVSVFPPLLSATPTPTSSGLDPGQSITLKSNVSGGDPSYSYQWYSAPKSTSPCTSGSLVPGGTGSSVTVSPPTTTYYCYQAGDKSQGAPPASSVSGWALVTVNGSLTVTPVTPASPILDQGQSIVLSGNASGGTPSYAYQWYSSVSGTGSCSGGTPITGATSPSYPASPVGNLSYCYVVTDTSQGHPPATAASAWDIVTVNGALTVGPITPASPTVAPGQSVTLTAHPGGGSPTYVYQWYSGSSLNCASDSTLTGATQATYVATPSASTYYCYVVTDQSTGSPAARNTSATDLFTVSGTGGPLVVESLVASPDPVAVGSSTTLTTVASGGISPYTYVYTGLPNGCTSSNQSTFSCAPNSAGNLTVKVTVTDAGGDSASNSTLLTVTVTGSGNLLITSFQAEPSSFGLGNATVLTVSVKGGTPPYAYTYTGLPPGCSTADAAQLRCTPTSPGNYTVTVVVADSTKQSAQASAELKVTGKVSALSVTLSSNATKITLGSSVLFTGRVTGGAGPFAYVWSVDGTNQTGPVDATWVFTPAKAGNYTILLWVKDARGVTVPSNVKTLEVTSEGSSPTTVGLSSWSLILLVVAALVALALVLLLVLRRRGKSHLDPPEVGGTNPSA
ncbi:MAG: hypothetical protein JRN35_09300, partial [Nitrososphaerota archaeon]|nr:hypothetical protein [Nitrososphaerota archaeon]